MRPPLPAAISAEAESCDHKASSLCSQALGLVDRVLQGSCFCWMKTEIPIDHSVAQLQVEGGIVLLCFPQITFKEKSS